jgi:hypothetical protein
MKEVRTFDEVYKAIKKEQHDHQKATPLKKSPLQTEEGDWSDDD